MIYSTKSASLEIKKEISALGNDFCLCLVRRTCSFCIYLFMLSNSTYRFVPGNFWVNPPAFRAPNFLAALASVIALSAAASPRHVYLTWQGDTSRTITINYQTIGTAAPSTVYFDTKSHAGRPADYRHMAVGNSHEFAGLPEDRRVHWVELEGLTPGETYYFIAGNSEHGFTPERKFRTMSSGSQSVRFVTGGDMGVSSDVALLLQQAAKLSPAFGVVGGDLAYANDTLTNYNKWDAWLDLWQTNMITPAGYTIPMVLAIGNHEVRGGTALTNARFYFQYFAQVHDRSYYARTFGKNLLLLLLDSGHISAHEGEQAAWVDAQLTAHRDMPQKFAVYHVPLYPSHRAYDGSASAKGRQYWLPLFDKHRLTAAFENHDHTFKRTHLLRENKADPKGTLYLGDGCWGMPARTVDAERRWYEAKAASIQHFWCVDVNRGRVEYRAISKDGEVFDVFPPGAAGAKEAEKNYEVLKLAKP